MDELHKAAKAGDVAAVAQLLDEGADIEAVDDDYYEPPLFFAVRADRLEVVRLLLDRGADIQVHGGEHGGPPPPRSRLEGPP